VCAAVADDDRRMPNVLLRALAALLVVLLALLLGACAQAPADEGTALQRALARVDGPFPGYLDFADRGAAAEWRPGGLDAERDALLDVLGIDLAAADAVLAVGQPPQTVRLVLGGQDENGIRSRAEAGGWGIGDGALRRELDVREPLTLTAGAVRPLGEDVVVGGPTAPVGLVDGPGGDLAGEPEVRSMAACLGDVAVAVLVGGDLGPMHAVGLRRVPGDDAASTSVVCATATTADAVSAAVTTGVSRSAGRAWSELLRDPAVEELPDGVVRLVARTAPDVPPTLLLSAVQVRELPGVPR
jgi:hypothetical protein